MTTSPRGSLDRHDFKTLLYDGLLAAGVAFLSVAASFVDALDAGRMESIGGAALVLIVRTLYLVFRGTPSPPAHT